jgi:hypothetical protein
MNDSRQDARAGKSLQPREIGEPALNTNDLTCQEAQIEELLSKGESTEDESDEEQDDNPADPHPPK